MQIRKELGVFKYFSYKGFSLDAQFSFQYGNKLYDGLGTYYNNEGAKQIIIQIKRIRRWQKPGDKTDIPEFVYFNSSNSHFGFYKICLQRKFYPAKKCNTVLPGSKNNIE